MYENIKQDKNGYVEKPIAAPEECTHPIGIPKKQIKMLSTQSIRDKFFAKYSSYKKPYQSFSDNLKGLGIIFREVCKTLYNVLCLAVSIVSFALSFFVPKLSPFAELASISYTIGNLCMNTVNILDSLFSFLNRTASSAVCGYQTGEPMENPRVDDIDNIDDIDNNEIDQNSIQLCNHSDQQTNDDDESHISNNTYAFQ